MSHPFHHLQFGPGSIILDDGKRVETTCSHSLGPDCVSLTQPSDFSLNMHDEDMLIDVIMFSITSYPLYSLKQCNNLFFQPYNKLIIMVSFCVK